MSSPSRRDFMKLLTSYLVGASGLLGLAGIGRYLSYDDGGTKVTAFDLGPASAFAIGSRTRVAEIPALVLRDKTGFSALSLECTHLGCTVEDVPEGFQCPCHGSRYDSLGEVTRGPAARPLPQLRVEVSAKGNLVVYTD
jgi:cytochrome b6-f complex iron-sulfur subunit